MRLIDADRLLNPGYTDMFDEPIKLNTFSRYAIISEPTVEAIPVEWIEKRIDSYIQFYKEKEKREPALALSISHSINAISELLDDWREENEI